MRIFFSSEVTTPRKSHDNGNRFTHSSSRVSTMRTRLATAACAAALVALLVAPTPARAFNLFPSHWTREETHAEPFSEEARERAELTGTCPDHCGADTCECSATTCAPASPVDRGAVHGPLGVSTAAAMRRAVDRAVSTARYRLRNLHFPGHGRGDGEDTRVPRDRASTTVSVSDILDDLERQLFLASPASAGVALHESPLSALARAGHRALDVFPSLGVHGKTDEDSTKFSNRLWRSAMDVRERDDAVEFVADVPGARDEDVEVFVVKGDPNERGPSARDVLVVRGERDDVRLEEDPKKPGDEKEEKQAAGSRTVRVRERHFGAFENRYALPPSVDVDRISAKTSKGVLTVIAPKRPVETGEGPEHAVEPPKREVKRVAVAAE